MMMKALNYRGHAALRCAARLRLANNILCAGTNGDFSALTFEEKVKLTAEVADPKPKVSCKVIVNAGMPATYETVQLAKEFDAYRR